MFNYILICKALVDTSLALIKLLCKNTLPHLASSRLASPRLTSPRLASPRLASPRLASPRLASPRLASPRLASPRLASPRLASPRLASPRLDLLYLALPCLMLKDLWRVYVGVINRCLKKIYIQGFQGFFY